MVKPQSPARNEQEIDEQTPLLSTSTIAPTTEPNTAEATITNHDEISNENEDNPPPPLPRLQLFLLCFTRVIEPIVFFSIFPFINTMVQRNGHLPTQSVGFYSGLIESLFSLTQMIVMIPWGRMSDRFGRKPILTVSLFGLSFTTALFGFGNSIGTMILYRCLAGMFAGSTVTIRTMISEISTKETQARAFSFFAFAQNMGIFLGPLLGGALADPAGQYGGVFGRVSFFRKYPYALATGVTGILGFIAALVALFFVRETKVGIVSGGAKDGKKEMMSIWEILKSPGVPMVLYLYAHVMLLAFAYTAIVPLFWFTTPELGGLGFSPFYISIFMGLTGLSQAIWLLVIFPPLHKRVGTGGIMNGCAIAYPFFFLLCPLLNVLIKAAASSKDIAILFWIITPVGLSLGVGVSMSFTAVQLALNDISPGTDSLGTLNSLALTLVSGLRAFAPWFFSSLFAIGAKTQVLGGYMIWFVLVILAAGFTVASRWLPEKSAGNGVTKNMSGSDEED